MSDQVVRSHTNTSNRAKVKDAYERKVVYKSVLDNPFTVQWPRVPTNLQNAIISQTVAVLEGVAAYHTQQARRSKRKSAQEHERRKRRKTAGAAFEDGEAGNGSFTGDPPTAEEGIVISNEVNPSASAPQSVDVPDILQHVTFGINEVTKKLEALANTLRQTRLKVSSETDVDFDSAQKPRSQLVLVCTGDINPPILVGHLPGLVAACNSVRLKPEGGSTWLVPLPAGAEQTLSIAAGLRRVSVLLLDSAAPQFEVLQQFLGPITPLRASWLVPANSDLPHALVPTHIKQLKTTAPKDMRAAKEIRAKRRAEAKDRKKEKITSQSGKL